MLHTESKIVFTKLNTVCLVYGCILYGKLYLLNNILHILNESIICGVFIFNLCFTYFVQGSLMEYEVVC